MEALAEGEVVFKGGLLTNVLLVPGLKYNLFAISAATSKGFNFKLTSTDVIIKKNNTVCLTGWGMPNGLSCLELEGGTARQNKEGLALTCSIEEWHQRFCHADKKAIEAVFKAKAIENLEIKPFEQRCLECALGKIKHAPHSLKSYRRALWSLGVTH